MGVPTSSASLPQITKLGLREISTAQNLNRIQHCYLGEGGATQERVLIVLLLGAFVTLASKILPAVGAHQKTKGYLIKN